MYYFYCADQAIVEATDNCVYISWSSDMYVHGYSYYRQFIFLCIQSFDLIKKNSFQYPLRSDPKRVVFVLQKDMTLTTFLLHIASRSTVKL